MSIEQDLQRALGRKPAPPDLADRVLARIDETKERRQGVPGDPEERRQGVPVDPEERRQGVPVDSEHRRPLVGEGMPSRHSGRQEGMPSRHSGRPGMRWLAAAAAVTLIATGGVRYYTNQQTVAEAERVKQDIRIALQITGEKLALAQERVARSADDSPP